MAPGSSEHRRGDPSDGQQLVAGARHPAGLPPRPPSGRLRLPALRSSLSHFPGVSERAPANGSGRPPSASRQASLTRHPSAQDDYARPPGSVRSGTPRTLSMPTRGRELYSAHITQPTYSAPVANQQSVGHAAHPADSMHMPAGTPFHHLAMVAAGALTAFPADRHGTHQGTWQQTATVQQSSAPAARTQQGHHWPSTDSNRSTVPRAAEAAMHPHQAHTGLRTTVQHQSSVQSAHARSRVPEGTTVLSHSHEAAHTAQPVSSPTHLRTSMIRRPLLAPRGANDAPASPRITQQRSEESPKTPTQQIAAAGLDAGLELSPQQPAPQVAAHGAEASTNRLHSRTSGPHSPVPRYGALLRESVREPSPHFAVGLEGLTDIRVSSMGISPEMPGQTGPPQSQQHVPWHDQRPSLTWGDNLYSRPTSSLQPPQHTSQQHSSWQPSSAAEGPRLRLHQRSSGTGFSSSHVPASSQQHQSPTSVLDAAQQRFILPSGWRVHGEGVAVLGGSSDGSEASFYDASHDGENQDPYYNTRAHDSYGHAATSAHGQPGWCPGHARCSHTDTRASSRASVSQSESYDERECDVDRDRVHTPFWPLPGMVVTHHMPAPTSSHSDDRWHEERGESEGAGDSEGEGASHRGRSCDSSRAHSPVPGQDEGTYEAPDHTGHTSPSTSPNRQGHFRPLLPNGLPPLPRPMHTPREDTDTEGTHTLHGHVPGRVQGRFLPPPSAPAGVSRGLQSHASDSHASAHSADDPAGADSATASQGQDHGQGLPFQQWMSTHAARLLLPHHMRHMADLFTADVLWSNRTLQQPQPSSGREGLRSRERFTTARSQTDAQRNTQSPDMPAAMQRGALFTYGSKPPSARASRTPYGKESPVVDLFCGRHPTKAVRQLASDAAYMANLLTSLPGVDPTSAPVMNMVLALAGAGRASHSQFSSVLEEVD